MIQDNRVDLLTEVSLNALCMSEGSCEVETPRRPQAVDGVTGKTTESWASLLDSLHVYELREAR